MKKILAALFLIMIFCGVSADADAQSVGIRSSTAYRVRSGTSDPATCIPGPPVTDIFINTTSGTLKRCSAANTWTAVGSSAPNYKEYIATLTQSGTSAPVAMVLSNTLGGTLVWSRVAQGEYAATLSGAFTVNKTALLPGMAQTGIDFSVVRIYRTDTSTITIITQDVDVRGSAADAADGLLNETTVWIRVYN